MSRFWDAVGEMDAETARNTVYESWHPKEGDRVRINLDSECEHRYKFAGTQLADMPSYAAGIPHRHELEHGAIGTVIQAPEWSPDHNGHVYAVRFDRPLPTPWHSYGQQIETQMYAAIELEPIEEYDGGHTVVVAPVTSASRYERR